MYNVIFNIVKHETKIKGYWKDKAGNVVIDNISEVKAENAGQFQNEVDRLFLLGENAVFVKGRSKAYILHKDGETETLNTETILEMDKQALTPDKIAELLKVYNGFTVYTEENKVKISIWN